MYPRRLDLSLTTQLLLLLIVATLTPLAFMLDRIRTDTFDAEQRAATRAGWVARRGAQSVGSAYQVATSTADAVSYMDEFWNGSDADRDLLLSALSQSNDAIDGLVYFGADLQQHGSSSQPSIDVDWRSAFVEARQAGTPIFASQPDATIEPNDAAVPIVVPIQEVHAPHRVGFLGIELPVERLTAISGGSSIVDESSELLVDTRTERSLGLTSLFLRSDLNFTLPHIENLLNGPRVFHTSDAAGHDQVAAWESVSGTPWLVLVYVPAESLLSPIRAQAVQQALVALGITALLSFLLFLFWRRLRRRLLGLELAAGNWASGIWSHRAATAGNDELVQVAKAFNCMAGQLQQLFTSEQEVQTQLLTEQAALEDRVRERTAQLQLTVGDLQELVAERERAERRLQVLSTASDLLTSGRGERSAIASVAQLTLAKMDSWCAIGLFDRSGVLDWVTGRSESTDALELLAAAAHDGPRVLPANAHRGSAMVVPLVARARQIGVTILARTSSGAAYTIDDLGWGIDLAQRVALAVDTATLDAALVERSQQLQEIVARLFSAQEEERRHVAIEVHDGVAQTAAATHQRLESLAAVYRPRSPQTRRDLQRARELARRTVQEARQIIAGLRPSVLDDFGLAAGLQQLAEQLRADGLQVTADVRLQSERLAPIVETALYRVAQEAVSNVRKHAAADCVRVSLLEAGGMLVLTIADNGLGFDPCGLAHAGRRGEQVGIDGMRERLTLLGGQLAVDSRPGGGTRVIAEVAVPTCAAD